jgi:putative pyoverdin transport system ATP-binding/permease protein
MRIKPASIFLALLIFCAPAPACSPSLKTTSSQLPSAYPAVDEFIQKQMREAGIPGVAVAVVQGGKIIYLKGFGVTSLNNPQPVTAQTVFDLASSSKSFTAMGTLILEDEGLIDIDQPFQKYVPDFTLADGAAARITVRDLLNQTSGLPGAFSEPMAYHDGPDGYMEMLKALRRVRTDREPGTTFEYANINYCLLGLLIQRVSGMSFEDFMSRELFVPAGLEHTTLDPLQAAGWERADGHQPFFGRLVVRNIPAIESARGAGWVMSCAEDMARWLILQLDAGRINDKQLLPADDITESQSPEVEFKENGSDVSYGMGWFSGNSKDGTPLIYHGGDTPNFMSDMLLVPGEDFGVVVLANAQSSSLGHSLGPGVANLIAGLDLERSAVPWWAYWKTIDTIGICGMAVSICLIIGLALYLWRIGFEFSRKKRYAVLSPWAKPALPVYVFLLYMTPFILLALIFGVGYTIVQTLFGYNPFQALIDFRLVGPPGVWVAAITFFSIASLWAMFLAFVALFTRTEKRLNATGS